MDKEEIVTELQHLQTFGMEIGGKKKSILISARILTTEKHLNGNHAIRPK